MLAQTARRLPGFRFEAQSPPLAEVLPRMDVAVLVGFAASGPLHRPVPLEDAAHFEEIFGPDLPLAWDAARGETVYAYLAPAVRAFFRNGGQRCWVVRVADQAQTNSFPIPGLALVKFDKEDQITGFSPAFAQARSPGSWSDGLGVAAALLTQPVVVERVSLPNQSPPSPLKLSLNFDSPKTVIEGDLLRLNFKEGGYVLLGEVGLLDSDIATSPPSKVPTTEVTIPRAVWLQSALVRRPPVGSVHAEIYTHLGSEKVSATLTLEEELSSPPVSPLAEMVSSSAPIRLRLEQSLINVPQPGSLIRIVLEVGELWLVVEELGFAERIGSPLESFSSTVEVRGAGWWRLTEAPTDLSDLTAQGERLTFELWTRQGEKQMASLSDLGFAPSHPRGWDMLPTDEQLYPNPEAAPAIQRPGLWDAANDPRYPLAGYGESATLYIPIGMAPLPTVFLSADPVATSALERDGLASFNAELFLDEKLAQVGPLALLAEADFLRYESPTPRALTGIHTALSIEEATLIAVPDAVHRGWQRAEPPAPLSPIELSPLERLTWWHFLPCDPMPTKFERVPKPHWAEFLDCDLRVIAAPEWPPEWQGSSAPQANGTFTLAWVWSELKPEDQKKVFVLEEATRSDFSDAHLIYQGHAAYFTLYGHALGEYYYRVRVQIGEQSSDWSLGLGVRVSEPLGWRMNPSSEYADVILSTVQRALLRLCAARGDLFAVLALPEHYRETEAIQHVKALASLGQDIVGGLDERTLSFGALYHPWLLGREVGRSAPLRRTPPDGALCGSLAQRAIRRGAWIAPANEPLPGVVTLNPALDRGRWPDFQAAQINIVWQEPRGFMALNADTLSSDPDLRLINVRRLLILLRRLALRLGATYVFEPHDDVFRRQVQRGFEALLDRMFVRGAFAGKTPATAYQVAVTSTPQDVDVGRFSLELRVAPAQPMTFLTLRLIQSGERGLVLEEV